MKLSALIIALLPFVSLGQPDVSYLIIARNAGDKIVANGDTIRVMGFAQTLGANPKIPGPTLVMNEGDSVYIDLWNVSQGAPHTIHLHGLDVNQANDGVSHLSFDVGHMEHGYYKFKAPHAGTYLYHCHVGSIVHIQGGMYGQIIVRPTDGSNSTWDGGYDYDVTMAMMFSEIDTTWHNDTIINHDHDSTSLIHYVTVRDYNPQYFLVNGMSDHQITDSNFQLTTSVGALNYLRLTNIGYRWNKVIFPASFGCTIIDSDGRPLPITELSDTVVVYPGERYGVLGTFLSELTDVIKVEYYDMFTGELGNTQLVPVVVDGYVDREKFENEDDELSLFPNPTCDELFVSYRGEGPEANPCRIINSMGETIHRFTVDGTNAVDVRNLSSGIYLVEVSYGNGNRSVKTFVKW